MSIFNASGLRGAGGSTGAIVWPVQEAVSAYADSNGTSATPSISTPAAGRLVLAWCHLVNGGSGVFAAAPAGEGWSRVVDVEETAGAHSASSLFWKLWGVSGNTDDPTPTFTAAAGALGVVLEVWKNVQQTSPIHASDTTHGTSPPVVPADVYNSASERVSASVFAAGLTAAGNISSISGTNYSQTFAGGSYATTAGSDRAVGGCKNENFAVQGYVESDGVTATFSVAPTAWTTIAVIIRGP